MTVYDRQTLLTRIDELKLEKSNTDDFMEQMDFADEIHNIEMKYRLYWLWLLIKI